jgi:acyl CoA:acetate/3-ketoacid CoA transferase beta subunit
MQVSRTGDLANCMGSALEVTPHGLKVVELAPGFGQQDIITQTGAPLNISVLHRYLLWF